MLKSRVLFTPKFFVILGVIFASLIAYGYDFPSENLLNHFPYLDILSNPDLYPHDFYVQEFTQFSPRYYYQIVIMALMSLGLPLAWIYFGIYSLSYIGFVSGLFALSKWFNGSWVTAATVSFLALSASVGTVGFVDLFRTEPIPAIWSMGFVTWGFFCCYSNRWIRGYFLFGLASLFQFLVGIFPGVLMLPLLLVSACRDRRLKTLILSCFALGGLAACVYIPMKLAGVTSSELLSHQEFIHIYGEIRHPHHIIFSSLGYPKWRDFILFTIAGIINIATLPSLQPKQKQNLLVPIVFGALLLPFGYIFVELYPISLVAKLQLARLTPFMQLLSLLGFSLLAQTFYRQRNVGSALLLVILLILDSSPWFAPLLVTLVVTQTWRPWTSSVQSRIALAIAVILLILKLKNNPSQAIRDLGWLGILWGCLMIPAIAEKLRSILAEWKRFSKPVTLLSYGMSLVPLLILILGLQEKLPPPLQNPFTGRISFTRNLNDPLYHLGRRVQQTTPEDALILIPGSSHQFRTYCQRSVVFAFKSIPFSDRGMQEWFRRWQSFQVLAPSYKEHTPEQLTLLAQQFAADYVLTRQDWHGEIPYPILDREEDWVIYQVPNLESAHHD